MPNPPPCLASLRIKHHNTMCFNALCNTTNRLGHVTGSGCGFNPSCGVFPPCRNVHPKFKFAYHGPPSNSAFWPGALLDKVRLYLDSDSQRASSLRNIFHPVGGEDRLSQSLTSKSSWPENDAGYVQFGTLPTKPHIL